MKIIFALFLGCLLSEVSSQTNVLGLKGKIAFEWCTEEKCAIYLINPDGTGLQQITPDTLGVYYGFSISPDGTKLIFGNRKNDNSMIIVDINSGAVKKLAIEKRGIFPVWSPDGKYIAFTCYDTTGSAVCIMPVDTPSQVRQITNNQSVSTVAWFPDSKNILFRGKGYDLFKVNIDNPEKIQQLTYTGTGKEIEEITIARKHPIVSPDGEKIAYIGGDRKKHGIYIMNADGTNLRFLFEASRDQLAWSPDSKYLVTGSLMKGGKFLFGIYIIDLNGNIVDTLVKYKKGWYPGSPSWSLH